MRWNGFAVPEQAPDSILAAKTVDVRVFPLAAALRQADGFAR